MGRPLITPGRLIGPSLSPDGNRVAFHKLEGGGADVWIEDVTHGSQVRLTFDPGREHASAIWSPDATRVAYRARRGDKWAVYEKAASGEGDEVLLVELSVPVSPMSWSPDGRYLLLMVIDPATVWDIWVWSREDKQASPMLATPFNEGHPQFSPDGKWVAYVANHTGANQVYVESFPAGRGKWQVPSDDDIAEYPRWPADGKALMFLRGSTGKRSLAASDVTRAGNALQFSRPRELFVAGPLVTGPVSGNTGNIIIEERRDGR
jgi:Tol biopolymer transport system component